MGRVNVTDPMSGAVIEVESDSPIAKAWGQADEKPEKKAAAKPAARK